MRILGWIAMGLGVIGVVVSVALAAGVWAVKAPIESAATGFVTAADDGLERALVLTEKVTTRLDEATTRVAQIKTRADDLVANPIIPPSIGAALATAVSDYVSGPYAALRTDYVALRERAMAAGESLAALDRAVEAVSLPGVVAERLRSIDERLVEIDATVTTLGQAGAAVNDDGVAARISTMAANVGSTLETVNEAVTDVELRLQAARDRLATADDRVSTLLTILAGVGSIGFLYLAGLHVLLFQQGRRWKRR